MLLKNNQYGKSEINEYSEEIRQLIKKIENVQIEKAEAVKENRYDVAASLRDMEAKLWKEIHLKIK